MKCQLIFEVEVDSETATVTQVMMSLVDAINEFEGLTVVSSEVNEI